MKTTVRKSKFSFHLISFMLLIGNLALCQRPSVSLNFKSVCTVNGGRTTKYTFACYNLGAVAFSNPHTPRWELIGNYWQWGRSTKAANGPSNGSGGGNGDGSRAIHIGRNKLLRALQRSQIEQVPVDEQDIVCGNPVERMPIQPGNHRVIAPPVQSTQVKPAISASRNRQIYLQSGDADTHILHLLPRKGSYDPCENRSAWVQTYRKDASSPNYHPCGQTPLPELINGLIKSYSFSNNQLNFFWFHQRENG